MTPFDLITMGRVSVDLYPEQIGVAPGRRRTFAKSLGGSATNVAVAAARLGHRTAVITKVGDDPFGPYVRRALRDFGVDDRWVGTHPTLRTPIVFCEIHPPDDFPLLFYREPKAPDMKLAADDLDLDAVRAARVFWTTGTGLSDEPSRTATLTALRRARRASGDHRPRPRPPADVLARRGRGRRAGRARRWRTPPSRSATATRSRSPSARATRTRRRRRCSSSACGSRSSSRARRACSSRTRRRAGRGPAGAGRGGVRPRRGRRVRRRARARAARGLGHRARRCGSRTPPARRRRAARVRRRDADAWTI